jgi:hypothetical protein
MDFCYKDTVNNDLFIYLLLYFALLLLAGFFFSKKIKTIEDFFLASRDLPALLILLTLAGSWLGATSTLVSVDEAFDNRDSCYFCPVPHAADPAAAVCNSAGSDGGAVWPNGSSHGRGADRMVYGSSGRIPNGGHGKFS